jgi:predicted ester cyclase
MEFLNTGDDSIADEIISDSKWYSSERMHCVISHTDTDYNEIDKNTVPGASHSNGKSGVKAQVHVMRAAFPDGHWEVQQYIELPEQGRIATQDLWTGTHLGTFMGVPATGKKIHVLAFA